MTDRTIRVSEETWRTLQARKRDDESFEDVILRSLNDDPLAGFGAWAHTEIDEAVREVKEEMDADWESRSDPF